MREQLERIDVAGSEYWLDPALPDRFAAHRSEAESVHLLPGFDEMVLGYADRTATIPPDHAERIVPGNNGVFRPTVLVDGVAVGTWRRKRDAIEVEPFSPLSARVQASVQAAVEQLP